MIDEQHVHWRFASPDAEAELIRQGSEDGGAGCRVIPHRILQL